MKRIIVCLGGLLSFAIVAPLDAQVASVTVTGGKLLGMERDGVVSFKGVPFAAPPIGALRWKAPQPLRAWAGTKTADTFAPGCMQDTNFPRFLTGVLVPNFSEDCLYLNVWTPAKSASERRAVMVWIHGGSFAFGTTNMANSDPSNLAKKGVVIVNIAYRLGAFGFLAHPKLSKENGKSSGITGC